MTSESPHENSANPFQASAEFYDLLYEDRDLSKIADFAYALLDIAEGQNILDLGCGTGSYICEFAQRGCSVHGIDISEPMLAIARKRIDNLKLRAGQSVRLTNKNIASFDLNEGFDHAISLFHVVSYLTTQADLTSMFQSVNKHLRVGGRFLFDFWYGPAVVAQSPERRQKIVEDENHHISREALAHMNFENKTVEVSFDFTVLNKADHSQRNFSEKHLMRYWYCDELTEAMSQAGLELICFFELGTDSSPSLATWGVTALCQKV